MIKIDTSKYKENGFEDLYFKTVWKVICRNQKKDKPNPPNLVDGILFLIVRYGIARILGIDYQIPNISLDEYLQQKEIVMRTESPIPESKEQFRKLILADFPTLKKACLVLKASSEYVADREKYKQFYEKYNLLFRQVSNSMVPDFYNASGHLSFSKDIRPANVHMNVRIVKTLGIRTCPYCNKEYIGNRGREVMGATLDHFFSRSEYPFFSVSLYNLIPSCNTCNTVKNDKDSENLISPFEEINVDDCIEFEYSTLNSTIIIHPSKNAGKHTERIQKSINALRLQEAYAFHSEEAERFLDRLTCYSDTQLEEIQDFLASKFINRSISELREKAIEIIYGIKMDSGETNQQPLTKLYRDLYSEKREGKYRNWAIKWNED